MLTVLRAESRRDENGRKRVVKEMLTDYPSHFSCRYFSWFQKSRQNYHSRSLAPAIRMCEQYTIRQGFSLQVPLYKCVYIALKRIHLIVHFGYEYIFHADHATLLRLTETGKLLIFVSTFSHNRDLEKLDSPFSGADPENSERGGGNTFQLHRYSLFF